MFSNNLPEQKAKRYVLNVLLALIQVSCAQRSVVTEYDSAKMSLQVPQGYQDSQRAISEILDLQSKAKYKDTKIYAQDILKILVENQETVAKDLRQNKKFKLMPGKSYSFQLESFCLDATLESPKVGDEHLVSKMDSSSQAWISLILSKYKENQISQNDAQVLIWSLMTGAKFDELSSKNQKNLLKIYPDAYVRFGSTVVESKFKDLIADSLPTEVSVGIHSISELKAFLQENIPFEKIERVLAPKSNRPDIFKLGWTKAVEGYFIKVEADGYQKAIVKIYAPENLPQNVMFDPTKLVTTPKKGQRLGLSSNVTPDKYGMYPPIGSVSLEEAALVVKYPLDAAHTLNAAIESENASGTYFKGEDQHNTRADAFRHFVWAGLAANDSGLERAREFLSAHEEIPNNPAREKVMDLRNNEEGFKFFQNYQGENFKSDLIEEGLQKVNKGELTWF